MIKLEDWLVKYTNPLEGLYALSHSQYVEDSPSDRSPYHIDRLHGHLFDNMRDCLHDFKQDKWQIIFIGSFKDCMDREGDLKIMKKWDIDQLDDWAAKTLVEYCEEK